MRVIICLIAIVGIGSAQFIALKAGVPPLGRFETRSENREYAIDHSFPFTVGLAIEKEIHRKVAVELSGLYRSIGVNYGGGYSFFESNARERGYAWEFPVVAKYHVKRHLFALAGPSTEWLHTHTDASSPTTVLTPQGPTFPVVYSHYRSNEVAAGLTAGLGVDRRAGPLRLGVEFRYTRWVRCPFMTVPDQVSVVMSIAWGHSNR